MYIYLTFFDARQVWETVFGLGVEGVLEQMDKRLTDFRGDSNTRLNHIESRLNWTLGTIITMWILGETGRVTVLDCSTGPRE